MRTLQDVRFAVRLLTKRPGFAAVAIATLALGVGAATSIFTVVEAVLLRPLPFPEPTQLVHFHIRGADGDIYPLPDTDFLAWRERSDAFSSVAVYDGGAALALTGQGEAARIIAVNVTDRFFATLGAAPLLGRTFQPGEDRPEAPKTIVLSHAFWRRHFHGDPGVVGRAIRLDGTSHTIIGVMPASFAFPEADLDGWPILTMKAPPRRGPFYSWGIGRLRPGLPLDAGRANIAVVEASIKRQYPGPQDWKYSLVPLQERIVGDIRRILYLLLVSVGFLLLIATANVANLLLARAGSRTREMAVRTAIGAGRGRLVAQLLTESLVLGVCGSAAGLVVAAWGTKALLALAPAGIPRLNEVGLNVPVFSFAVTIASLCAPPGRSARPP
jgi:putative ABC transport system permease protein